MLSFVNKLLEKSCPEPHSYDLDSSLISKALDLVLEDVRYYYPLATMELVVQRIKSNQNELPLFIFRFGSLVFSKDQSNDLVFGLNSVNKVFAGCEIYFSNEIDIGFNIIHGLGTVIGSRNKIGKGFMIYQNCTLGHFADFQEGLRIGDDVTIFPGSQIIGELSIGNQVIVGCNSFVNSDIPSGVIFAGSPAKQIGVNAVEQLKKIRANYR